MSAERPYFLKAQLARKFGIPSSQVERVFPVTLLGGRKRFLRIHVERVIQERTQTPASRTSRTLPMQKDFITSLREVRQQLGIQDS